MIALLAIGALLAAPGVTGPDCYGQANAAYSAGAFGEAGAAFEASAGRAVCAHARGRLLVSAGEAFRREAERTGDHSWSCRALDAYEAAKQIARRRRIVDAAIAGAVGVAPACDRPQETESGVRSTPSGATADEGGSGVGWVIAGTLGAAAAITAAIMLASSEPETVIEKRVRVLPVE